eukprot:TRINITY_DN22972_c0_g1_i1.p1 TRINITY_DN22972_c0_g1~~TRINITY_DN22972_c0_g1_i1.p1  ORF type:complete len:395 (-),score=49.24 TRINITY_DN22972_c0_g1_i1:122-1306(-)
MTMVTRILLLASMCSICSKTLWPGFVHHRTLSRYPSHKAASARSNRLGYRRSQQSAHTLRVTAGDGYVVMEGLLTQDEVETLLDLTKHTDFNADTKIRTALGDNQVWQRTLYELGTWQEGTECFQSILRPPLKKLEQKVLDVGYDLGEDIAISRIFLCRYLRKEGQDMGTRELEPHIDLHAMLASSCSLSVPRKDSGFYVVEDASFGTKRTFPLQAAGDFAVHRWDLLHGVSTKPDEDRYSLLVWWRPRGSFANITFFCKGAQGNAEQSYHRGMNSLFSGEATFAEQWFRLGAEQQSHEPSKAALALSLSLLGRDEEARAVKRDCSDAASIAVAEFLGEQGAANLADTLLNGIDSPEDKAAKQQQTQIYSAFAVILGLAVLLFIVFLVSEILFA